MTKLPKIALGAWAWGNQAGDPERGTEEAGRQIRRRRGTDPGGLELNVIRFWEKEMK